MTTCSPCRKPGKFFAKTAECYAKLAAPALTEDSFATWWVTVRNIQFTARRVSFAGDTIKISGTGHTVAHTAQVNGGQDTLITLSDNSTILLKHVNSVNNSIFS